MSPRMAAPVFLFCDIQGQAKNTIPFNGVWACSFQLMWETIFSFSPQPKKIQAVDSSSILVSFFSQTRATTTRAQTLGELTRLQTRLNQHSRTHMFTSRCTRDALSLHQLPCTMKWIYMLTISEVLCPKITSTKHMPQWTIWCFFNGHWHRPVHGPPAFCLYRNTNTTAGIQPRGIRIRSRVP